jgi:hypothetical protein
MSHHIFSRLAGACALTVLLFAGTVWGGTIYTSASWDIVPDNAVAGPGPTPSVRQNLPVGDTMTVTFTHNGSVIKNGDGSTPTMSATVGAGTGGASFLPPGTINGQTVTDYTQTHTAPGLASGTIQIAAFQNASMTPVGIYLEANFGSNTLSIPDFSVIGQDIYYGVDLATYGNQGVASVGTTYAITDGLSDSLAGYLFSNTLLTAGDSGWESSSLFTGTVTLDSSHDLSVPEPSTLLLFGIGAIGVLATRRRAA